jgi:guanine deaminase
MRTPTKHLAARDPKCDDGVYVASITFNWAQVSRLVFGATSHDVATYGFEDLQLYRELATSTERRSLTEVSAGGSLRDLASDVLRSWAENFPEPVTPKY